MQDFLILSALTFSLLTSIKSFIQNLFFFVFTRWLNISIHSYFLYQKILNQSKKCPEKLCRTDRILIFQQCRILFVLCTIYDPLLYEIDLFVDLACNGVRAYSNNIDRPTMHSLPFTKLTDLSSQWRVGWLCRLKKMCTVYE